MPLACLRPRLLGAALISLLLLNPPNADATDEFEAYDVRNQTPTAHPAPIGRAGEALTPPDGREAAAILRDFLQSAALTPEGEQAPELAPYSESTDGELRHLYTETLFFGAPVYGGEISAHFDRSGRLLRLQRGYAPQAPRRLAPNLSPRQAAEAAIRTIAPERASALEPLEQNSGPRRRSLFQSPELSAPIPVSLVWFPLGDEVRAAWRLYLEIDASRAYEVVVDADDGAILLSFNLARESEPTGSVFLAPATPHPGAGTPSVQSLAGRPAEGLGACPASIYPVSGFACWTPGDLTRGNNADVCYDINGDDICDGRAEAHSGSFVFPFTNSFNLYNNAAADRNFALVNAFYWTNALHDWLYPLGFTEAAGNFQTDNFGRGGQANDPVRVDIHDGFTNNQATFLTPPDGIAPRMNLGLFVGLRRDSALDGDVITHEYAHGVSSRLVGGPLNATSLYLLHSAALSEAWSDAFAFAFTGDPVFGEYVTDNSATGLRTVRYDQNALTFGDFGLRRSTLLPFQNRLAGMPQGHIDGEIWASTLWDVRKAVGHGQFPGLLVESLKMTPPRPSFLDARDALLQAATALGLGGPSACGVWTAFAARGMGASAALNAVDTGQLPDSAISVYESFDLPIACGGAPPAAGATLHFEGAEAESQWTATGLWHRSSRRSASGAMSWRFGRPDAADYNTGQREFGELLSPAIALPVSGGAVLEWGQFLRNEGFWRRYFIGGTFGPYLNLDSARVWISADDGPWRVITHIAHPTPGDGFVRHRINLSRFAGRTIRLRVDFDTFTAAANAHEGLYLDDIRILALEPGAEPATLSVSPSRIDMQALAGQTIPPVSVEIRNTGGGLMSWSAMLVNSPSWLTWTPPSGQGDGAVQVQPSPVPAGLYEAVLRIDAGAAGGVDIPVTLTASEPAVRIAEWRLDEPGSGAGVSITGQMPGLTTGPGSLAIPGVEGLARRFNGWSDGVATAFPLALPERFTVNAWVRLSHAPQKLALVVSAFGGANHRGWYLGVTPDRRAVWMAATPPSSAPWLLSQSSLEPGRWSLLTATYDRSSHEAQLYINGRLEGARQFPGLTQESAFPLTLGKASWTENYHFPGAIDEVSIESGVRLPAEAAAAFDSFSPPELPVNLAVRGDWRFESANRSADSSGNQRHAAALAGTSIDGVSGQALRLNGATDAVLIPAHEQLSPDDFTVAFWIRPQGLPGASGAALVSNLGATSGWEISIDPQGRVQATLAAGPGGAQTVTAPQALPLGAWKRAALTYRSWSRMALLYVDGALVAQRWIPGGMTPRADGDLTIGRSAAAADRFARFDIDELAILPNPWDGAAAAADFAVWTPPPPPSPADLPASAALVAQWELDETTVGSGVVFADSIGGHNAVTAAARNRPHQGLGGVARNFGGWPDSAAIASHPDLHTESFSFSSWVRLDELPANWGALYSTHDGQHSGWLVGVYNDGRLILSVTGPPNSKPWLLSTESLNLGHWHHVAVTFDGPSRRGSIYLDGQRVASAVFPSWNPSAGVNPTIGRTSWAQTGFLKLSADRIRLYNYERSTPAVQSEFEELAKLRDPAPLGLWEMDEVFLDSGPSARHGDLSSTVATAAGRFDNALLMRGRPDSGILPPDQAWEVESFTYSAWVRLEALPATWGTLFSTYDGDRRGWFVGAHGDGRVILCVVGLPGSSPWLLSQSSLTPGRWTKVTATFDAVSRQGTIYFDGDLEATAVFPAFVPSSGVSPTLGRASWTDSYYLPIAVDRMRLDRLALSLQQIQARVME